MILVVVLAVLAGFLVYGASYGISYLLVPEILNQVPPLTPAPSMIDELFGASLLIGLAALIAFTLVVAGLLFDRLRSRNRIECPSKDSQ